MQRALIAFLLLLTLSVRAEARTWHIRPDHSGDAPTIQAGVDSAAVGDTVLVAPGTYGWSGQGTGSEYGMIHIQRGQNGFVLRSEAGPQATFLDGEYQGRIFFIAGWNYITVEGFTIRRGMAPPFGEFTGAGIATHLSFDTIRNCIFRDNIANYGGALWCGGVSAMQIIDCQFYNNQAITGGAIYLVNSSQSPTIRNCVFHHNTASNAGGAIHAIHNGFHLENCLIALNEAGVQGGAIGARDVWPSSITSCTIADNTAPDASALHLNATQPVAMSRCIVARCTGGPAFTSLNGSVLTLACSDVFGNPSNALPVGAIDAGGNLSADPLFCGLPASLNYTIAGSSPCAPGSHPDGGDCGLIGALPPACGTVRVQAVTWGQLKALYR
ncbi:MAG TPA: right-handed parallel beta-helix repeat-containing protein [Candidatus Krumholzibacteria bacterium]|nr:right-handed parallel beta-helix repeat-containing protein [Candidatus Krumholzibacteria bacterium]